MKILICLPFLILNASWQSVPSNKSNLDYPNIIISIQPIDGRTKEKINSVECELTIYYELEKCQSFEQSVEELKARIDLFKQYLATATDTEKAAWRKRIQNLENKIMEMKVNQKKFEQPMFRKFSLDSSASFRLNYPIKKYKIVATHKDYYPIMQTAETDCFGTMIQLEMFKK